MVGIDATEDNIETVELFTCDIPTEYLKHFTVYVMKNYDKFKKPIKNITDASQEYKKRLRIAFIQKGEENLTSVEETRAFLQEFFKGCKIANCITGLYQPFVSISLDENGTFINDYANKKLNSAEENDFYFWCFQNQIRIGDVKIIKTETIERLILENNKKIKLLAVNNTEDNVELKEITRNTGERISLNVKRM